MLVEAARCVEIEEEYDLMATPDAIAIRRKQT